MTILPKSPSRKELSAKDYNLISNASYNIDYYRISSEIEISKNKTMYVVDYKETNKGLNTLTIVSEEDFDRSNGGKDLTKIKNAVIAYRGSEPIGAGQYKDTIKKHGKKESDDLLSTILTKLPPFSRSKGSQEVTTKLTTGTTAYTNEIVQDWMVSDTKYLIKNIPFEHGAENQMVQADRYAKEIHKKMPNAKMYVTGHSLGGSNASYVLVKNDFIQGGVTFENPNIYPNLSDGLQAKALKGDYRSRLTEYINLNDGLSLLNRHTTEIGRVKVMYDAALPEGVDYSEDSSKAVQFIKDLLNRAMSVNPSLDANLFLEALAGSHGLDRYTFSPDGSVQTIDDMLKKNPSLTTAMLQQLGQSNVDPHSVVAILIKSHVLMNTGRKFSTYADHHMQQIIRKIEKLDDKVDQSVERVRSRYKQIVGFGSYDQLTASDVDAVIRHLKTEGLENEFYSVKKYDTAIDSAMNMKRWMDSLSDDMSDLGKQYHDADIALAKNMGIS
ncbi:lipase family protein [Bacillus sp. AM 13(2015)]|uniref:lipase family protein n=1 Tax=Bacillus sp. AM 13(2015) TaxID=1739115 RepID=UPI001E5A3620|nr:lipase family protein [Bacillus sp. AM 13(2015)]